MKGMGSQAGERSDERSGGREENAEEKRRKRDEKLGEKIETANKKVLEFLTIGLESSGFNHRRNILFLAFSDNSLGMGFSSKRAIRNGIGNDGVS